MKENSKGRRRFFWGLINNKEKQFTYALVNVLATLALVLCVNSIVVYKISKLSDSCVQSSGELNPQAFGEVLDYMTMATVLMTFLVGGVCFYFILKLTHRFFGPLIPIYRHLELMEQGHFESRIVLRKEDELKDLASKLNHLTETLHQKYGSK